MSKWSKYNDQIVSYWNNTPENERSYNGCAKHILGVSEKTYEVDVFRTYIKRFIKRGAPTPSVVSNITDSVTTPNDYTESRVLTALDDEGKLMDIDRYCEYYKLPRKDITSYKLVTHTGTPFYNLVFKEQIEIEQIDFNAVIREVVGSVVGEKVEKKKAKSSQEVTRLVYTDTHVAMCTDSEGTSMYASPWDEGEIFRTLQIMCEAVVDNKVGNTLYIDDLGDILDGWEGKTTRGGHELPQNMSTQQAFKVALQFKKDMIEILHPHFDYIVCHNVSVDNHGGRFSMILNHSFKDVMDAKYDNVYVHNIEQFIGHYYIGVNAFVLTHGKDHKSMKFGFNPFLDTKQIEKIDHYLKHNSKGNVYREADEVFFCKGDSHRMLFDYSTAQDFNYFNYPALSPASEWVQTNFKKGHRGFVIEHIDANDTNIKLIPILI